MLEPTNILIRPLLTEKSQDLQRLGKYSFEVAMAANKIQIRRAVEELGKCQVKQVNTLIVPGKKRRTRRGIGHTPDWKKAIVTIKDGESLGGLLGEAFEGV